MAGKKKAVAQEGLTSSSCSDHGPIRRVRLHMPWAWQGGAAGFSDLSSLEPTDCANGGHHIASGKQTYERKEKQDFSIIDVVK